MGELILSNILIPVKDKLIGKQLKKARAESGLSQDDVATKIGLTWEMISRYENGRTSALKHLRKLADIYEKPITYFIESDEERGDSLTIKQLVDQLKDSGVTYNSRLRNVVKLIPALTGKGIAEDLKASEEMIEAKSSYTDNYPDLFALKLTSIEITDDINITPDDIAFLTKEIAASEGQIVLTFDGISYRLCPFDEDDIAAPVAAVIAIERRILH